jgi:hypothetical protein
MHCTTRPMANARLPSYPLRHPISTLLDIVFVYFRIMAFPHPSNRLGVVTSKHDTYTYPRRQQDTPTPYVQYRQLVSRGITQRIHSPSLDDLTLPSLSSVEAWEKQERCTAREKACRELQRLGVSWSRYYASLCKACDDGGVVDRIGLMELRQASL